MKKIFKLMAAFAATISAFSCVEEANPEKGKNEGLNLYDGPMTTIEFSLGELETKTSYDKENGHCWSDGDYIRIIWGSESNASVTAEVVNGKVSATVGEADTYYAVYPEDAGYTLSDGQLSVVIPMVQDGSFRSANIMAASTTQKNASLNFKNLTHIFKFSLSEDSKHKGFSFRSNTVGDIYLSGTVPVTFNADDTITLGEITSGSTEVRAGDMEPGKTYYLGLCPDADMSLGFGFKATKTGGTTSWSEGALTTAEISTGRSQITYIPEIDKAIRDNWFFKPGGQGDGSSWENAGGETLLTKLLGKEIAEGTEYNKVTNGWRIYGAQLHLAQGTYTLPATIAFNINVNNKTEIFGGYPDNLEGCSLEGRDASTYKTIISKAGGTRLFYGNNSLLYNWTWDGITFTSTEALTERGGLFYANGGTSGTIRYANCTFDGLATTNTTGGGAFDFNAGDNSLNVSFENCTFTGCKSPKGGSIVVESGSKTILEFDQCIFSGNEAGEASTNGNTETGGAIHMAHGEAHFNQCIFDGNAADLGAHIYMITSNPKVFINRSVFKNGTAYYKAGGTGFGTAIHSSNTGANLYVNNCIFYKNESKNYTTNNGLPCIYANGVYTLVINSSFAHKGIRTIIPNNGSTSAQIINNMTKNLGDRAIEIANNGTRKYNITITNATDNDTNISSNDNLAIVWEEVTNLLTWTLANVTISKWATVSEISTIVSTNFESFDTWLKSVETDPYGIDFYGNVRNKNKMNPGAWDNGIY